MYSLNECIADLLSMVLPYSLLGQDLYLWPFDAIHQTIWLSRPQSSVPYR